jgi:hypothetical protein
VKAMMESSGAMRMSTAYLLVATVDLSRDRMSILTSVSAG